MKITNNTPAPQGVHAVSGLVWVSPGQSVDADLTSGQAERARRIDGLVVEGNAVAEVAPPAPGEGDSASTKKLVAERDKLKTELNAANGQVKTLTDRVAELEQASKDSTDGRALPAKLEATHRGRGSFSIMDANELVEGLDKDAADKFNALSDKDKAKFVAEALKTKAA
jgi:hypothetical protein